MHGLLFDLGGTFLRAAVAGEPLREVWRTRIPSVATGASETAIWNFITAEMVRYVQAQDAEVPENAPIVLSFPGPIASGAHIVQAPTVAGSALDRVQLPGQLERLTGRQVIVLNDVSAAAWGISHRTRDNRFLVVTVSSGIGSKLFDRCHGSGVFDFAAYAGEIGHVVVDDSPEAPVCDCGGRGHLGAISSGRGIERLARERALIDQDAFEQSLITRRFGATPEWLNNEDHLVPAFREDDPWVSAIVRESTRPLVRSLLTVAMAAGLDRVFVIGGFATASGTRYRDLLKELALDLSRYQVASKAVEELFVLAPTSEETCLEGCAVYLRQKAWR